MEATLNNWVTVMANNSPDLYLHYFYFQAFSDELDVRQGDFESIRSQGDRLVCQLSDQTEREVLRKQMDDISDRLDRIQNLVNERGQRIGERTHYGIVEFETALKDCYERIEQFKSNLQGVSNFESMEGGQERLQVTLNKKAGQAALILFSVAIFESHSFPRSA